MAAGARRPDRTSATVPISTPTAPTMRPTSPSVLAESADDFVASIVGPTAAISLTASSRRGPIRPMACDSSVWVGSLVGNSTFAGSFASSNVVGLEVKLWSISWEPMEPKKWKVYFPGAVGKNHAR